MHGHDRHNTKYEIASSLSSDKDRTHWDQPQAGVDILAPPPNKTPLTIDDLKIQQGTKKISHRYHITSEAGSRNAGNLWCLHSH